MGITRSPLPQHQGKLSLPLLRVKVSVILHDFIRRITIKTSHYGKLPDSSLKLPHYIFSDVFSIFIFPPKIPEQSIKNE